MAVIPGSVRVAGFIAPTDSTDTYAVHDDAYGRGGWRTVANITERNTISADRRKLGMAVRVLNDGYGSQKNYTLLSGLENADWEEDLIGNRSIDSDTTYYVDGDNGNDSYTGLSWIQAKKTFSFLYSKDGYAIPREVNAIVTIKTRGTILSKDTTRHTMIDGLYGSGTFIIDGETRDAVIGLVPTGWDNTIANVEYHSYLDVSTATWNADEYRGMFIQFTSPATDIMYPILSNTTTRIETVNLPDLTGTETFKIVELLTNLRGACVSNPSALINYLDPEGNVFTTSHCSIPFYIKKIKCVQDDFLSYRCRFSIGTSVTKSYSFSEDDFMVTGSAIYNCCITNLSFNCGAGRVNNCFFGNIKADVYISLDNYYESTVVSLSGTVIRNLTGEYNRTLTSIFEKIYINYSRIKGGESGLGSNFGANSYVCFDVLFEDCSAAINLSSGNLINFGYLKFKNNIVGISLIGTKVYNYLYEDVDHFFAHGSGNTHDIVIATEPTIVSYTFTDLNNKVPISNAKTGAAIIYGSGVGDLLEASVEYDNSVSNLDSYSYQGAIDILALRSIESDITYYVDGDNGSDAYAGLSWAAAKKTLSFLYSGDDDALPREINATATIKFRGTILSKDTSQHTVIDKFYGNGTLILEGQPTDVITNITPTGWQDGSVVDYHSYLDVSGAGWTVDAYKSNFIQFTTSPATETLYPIMNNTSSRLESSDLPTVTSSTRFKIVSVPKFRASTVADPITLVDYSSGNFTGEMLSIVGNQCTVKVYNCTVVERPPVLSAPIRYQGEMSGEAIDWDYSDPSSAPPSRMKFSAVVCNGLTYSSGGNSKFDYCLLLSGGGLYADGASKMDVGGCCFGGSSLSDSGLSAVSGSYVDVVGSRFSFCNVAISSSADGNLIFRLGWNNYFNDCANAIAPCGSSIGYDGRNWNFGMTPIRFKNCLECLNIINNKVVIRTGYQVFDALSGCTDEIVTSNYGGHKTTFTFADVTAGRSIANASSGGFVQYSAIDNKYLPYGRPEYDNTTSGLDAYFYQDAIDLLAASSGGSAKTIFSDTLVPLTDAYDFMLTETVAATDEAIVYLFESTPTVGVGYVIIDFYSDSARTQKVHEVSIDLADSESWISSESFGIQTDTTGTIYGTIHCSELDPGSTIDISLYANSISPTTTPVPMPGPYGNGIEDNGFGDPQIALATGSGLEFSSSKLRIKSDVTAPAKVSIGVSGASVTGVVNLTTDQAIAGQKTFDSMGLIPMDSYGSPIGGSWEEGIEVLDAYGVKWRRFQNTWELSDVVTEYPEVIAGTTLAYGETELFKIPVTGDVGQCLWLRVWARNSSGTAEMQIPFRARIYETSDVRGREMVWQGLGLARQTYLTSSLPASQTYLEVNSNNIIDVDELICVYESDNRFEIGRCSARPTGQISISEALVDSSTWNTNTLAIPVTEWWNIPWINRDGNASNQKHILLQIRHDGLSTDPSLVFYVQVLAQSRGIIK